MTPHYLRFARALALLSGLGACSTTGSEPEPQTSTNGRGTAGDEHAGPADGPADGPGDGVASGGDLNGCSCYGTPIAPSECPGATTCALCCSVREPEIMVGPLSPPDLPA